MTDYRSAGDGPGSLDSDQSWSKLTFVFTVCLQMLIATTLHLHQTKRQEFSGKKKNGSNEDLQVNLCVWFLN